MPSPAPSSPPLRFVLVGHCGPDGAALTRLVQALGSVEVIRVQSLAEMSAWATRDPAARFLVNRVLDATGEAGLDGLQQLPAPQRSQALLISNYPDAQAQAVDLGAAPGFGKSQLRGPEALACLQRLWPSSTPTT